MPVGLVKKKVEPTTMKRLQNGVDLPLAFRGSGAAPVSPPTGLRMVCRGLSGDRGILWCENPCLVGELVERSFVLAAAKLPQSLRLRSIQSRIGGSATDVLSVAFVR